MEAVQGEGLPVPIGPYSPALRRGEWVFVSGQIAPRAGGAGAEAVKAQTRLALEQVNALLQAAGLGMSDVLRTTVYMTDLGLFAAMNEVYAQFFKPPFPARPRWGWRPCPPEPWWRLTRLPVDAGENRVYTILLRSSTRNHANPDQQSR